MKHHTKMMAFAILTTLSLSLLTITAWADIPPPEDYVEMCTLDIQSENGAECIECGADFQVNTCADMHAAAGYTQSCQTWGGSAWTEIWCRPGAEIAGSEPPAEAGNEVPVAPIEAGNQTPPPDGAGADNPEAGSELVAGNDSTAKDTEEESCSQRDRAPIALWLGFVILSMLVFRKRSSEEG